MALSTIDVLMPARFLTLIGHLIVVIMIFFTKDENVRQQGNISQDEFDTGDSSLTAGLALSIICLAIEIFGLFGGFSMFLNAVNVYYVLSHFWATVLLGIFVSDNWGYISFWYIFGFLTAPPAVLELIVIICILVFKKVQY